MNSPSDKSRRLEIHAQLRALGLEGLLRLSNPFEVRQIILDALERTPSSTRAKTEEQALAGPLLTDEANFCSHCGDRVERPLQDGCSSSPCPVLRPVSAIAPNADTARLDWLERKVVNVRRPALYGSWNEFWCNPGDERNGEDEGAPSDLRKKIDEAMGRADDTAEKS